MRLALSYPFPESGGELFYNELLVEGKSRIVKPKAISVFRRKLSTVILAIPYLDVCLFSLKN